MKKTDGEKPDPNKPQEEKPAAEPKPAKAKPVPDDKRAPVPEARNPIAGKPPGELDAARRKASGIGLLAMKDQLAELHGAPAAVQLNSQIKPGPGVGASVGPGVGAGTEAGLPSRALISRWNSPSSYSASAKRSEKVWKPSPLAARPSVAISELSRPPER